MPLNKAGMAHRWLAGKSDPGPGAVAGAPGGVRLAKAQPSFSTYAHLSLVVSCQIRDQRRDDRHADGRHLVFFRDCRMTQAPVACTLLLAGLKS